MKSFIPRFSILLCFCAFSATFAEAPKKTVRLLTVGNSFAENATRFLPGLAEASGHTLILGRANAAGCSLERHWKGLQAAEAGEPAGQMYPIGKDKPKRSLPEMLTSEAWDYITLQQYSRMSERVETFRPFAQSLRDKIQIYAPTAEIVLYQTWAYRWDDTHYKNGSNRDRMHAAIRDAYHQIGGELDLRVIPVGDAFAMASSQPEWTYAVDPEFNFTDVEDPNVPEQPGSLHMGWRWITTATGERRFGLDGNHANTFGCYLAACVFLEFFFDENPVGNAYYPKEITPEQALSLQEIAHEAVQKNRTLPVTSLP